MTWADGLVLLKDLSGCLLRGILAGAVLLAWTLLLAWAVLLAGALLLAWAEGTR
jgi:hypothetical protein